MCRLRAGTAELTCRGGGNCFEPAPGPVATSGSDDCPSCRDGAAHTGVLVVRVCGNGISRTDLQRGHWARLPESSSFALSFFPHSQVTLMTMIGSSIACQEKAWAAAETDRFIVQLPRCIFDCACHVTVQPKRSATISSGEPVDLGKSRAGGNESFGKGRLSPVRQVPRTLPEVMRIPRNHPPRALLCPLRSEVCSDSRSARPCSAGHVTNLLRPTLSCLLLCQNLGDTEAEVVTAVVRRGPVALRRPAASRIAAPAAAASHADRASSRPCRIICW